MIKTLSKIFAFIPLIISTAYAYAEITVDNSLGKRQTLSGPNLYIRADLGQQKGSNLFHSFATFNLSTGENAVFSGPDTVKNIINRVTGGAASYLDGSLVSLIPDADMYFFNPAGIKFGPNARLNLQGSLYASTADYLRLTDNVRFETTFPENSHLSSAPPAAFGFYQDAPASIVKQESFLLVPAGKTLAFIGGDIELQDSYAAMQEGLILSSFIAASGGEIQLISIASAGEVSINPSETINTDSVRFGTIRITDDTLAEKNLERKIANVEVSGSGSGRVLMQGGKIILNNAYIFADARGGKNSRGIQINATETLILRNGARVTAQAVDRPGSTGNAGDIIVKAGNIELHQAKITSSSDTAGNAGNIDIEADKSIEVSGQFLGFSSGLSTAVSSTGKGGEIIIKTPALMVTDGADIRSDTQGNGDAGNIDIQVKTLNVNSGGQLSVIAGSRTQAEGSGNAGALKINAAEAVYINGRKDKNYPSALLSNVFSSGKGGEIMVDAPLLIIENDGLIQAGTQNTGAAGNIIINADKIHIAQHGRLSTETLGAGKGGDILINSKLTQLTENAVIATSSGNNIINTGNDNPGSENKAVRTIEKLNLGDAGNLYIDTDNGVIQMQNSSLHTSTTQSDGGNITLSSLSYLYLANSEVKTNVSAEEGNGGNIKINQPQFAVLQHSE
ncbi:two-partner secretion domain-containing protein, partial [Candidatus Venteria ishoeyi]|uniref:two-partner secretion domain-containing protein n=1 Tax=Candidatus Venteria ishoeyi TaxID=1899563 RepID=UPI0011B05A12